MTLILSQLREWQGEDGPAEWQAAWARALDLLGPLCQGREMVWDGPVLADGGAALAVAIYIIARESSIAPEQVHRAQIRSLIEQPPGTASTAVRARWETRLSALGHDLNDGADPVAVMWRHLRADNCPPADDAFSWIDDPGPRRWGPGYLEGLRLVLAPIHEDRLQF
ncbi:hypothetical protein [Streptomyces sp. NPDC088146]|uniref:hypothetical protein n=1 Tax=Streptomyces sp. NPDC088146 TaxID=3365829 RepID=UPI003824F052